MVTASLPKLTVTVVTSSHPVWDAVTSMVLEPSLQCTRGLQSAEMDLWEAIMNATAFTPHPAAKPGLYVCMKGKERASARVAMALLPQLTVIVATSTVSIVFTVTSMVLELSLL